MKRSVLICIGTLTVALTVNARMPYKATQKKSPKRTTAYHANRGTGAVRQAGPRRTFSPARSPQRAFSTAQRRVPTFRATQRQPRVNASLINRRPMTNTARPRHTRAAFNDDWAGERFNARARPNSAFVNRSGIRDIAARRQTRIAAANDWTESRFRERPTTSSSLANRSAMNDIVARRQTRLDAANDRRGSRLSERARPSNELLERFTMNDTATRHQPRAEFNNKWGDSNFRRQTRSSFVNRSVPDTPAIREQRRAAFSNNWRGDWYSGRQYWAFRNYQRQWHDSGWWDYHCDLIVFVTVYSQPFPFYFDAGYWYPCWGYYSDAYYPYDGPIYGYNDLSPDEIIANVQTQLYNEGYYDGPIDGILGPETRAAIADYQADHGLAVTAAIDEPTVESLGLV
jgi:Putative peptidoglycan binding domain